MSRELYKRRGIALTHTAVRTSPTGRRDSAPRNKTPTLS